MLALIPLLTTFIGGAFGWKLGNLVGIWTGSVAAIVGTALGFYYGRKLRRAVTP
jgi:uncharacterized membrane protein YdjX (TVP38/TMEM64 family)